MTSQAAGPGPAGRAETDARPEPAELGPDTRIGFGELSIVPEGEEYVVGDPAAGVFLSLPEIGVTAIENLRAGRTVGEVTAILTEMAGEDVKVAEFVAGLIEAGLVRSVDDGFVGAAPPAQRPWLTGVRPERARPLFGRVAWACYGLCAAWCVLCLVLLPEYRPSFESILFYPDPAVSIAAISALAIVIGSLHEAWHWLAARAEGAGVRFALSRRAFLPVFETDLTQLWATARRRRYSPLLAGLALDFTVMAVALALRVAAQPLGLPALLVRLLAVVVVVQLVGIVLQSLVFLRTDLYLVISTALGCQDLLRVTRLYLSSRLWPLNAKRQAELDAAYPRDRACAPWFAVIYLAGLGLLGWLLMNLWLPATAVMGGWVVLGLWHASGGQRTFWEGLVIAVILLAEAAWPLALYLKERITSHQRQR